MKRNWINWIWLFFTLAAVVLVIVTLLTGNRALQSYAVLAVAIALLGILLKDQSRTRL